jgi:hypothetical protein
MDELRREHDARRPGEVDEAGYVSDGETILASGVHRARPEPNAR